MRAVPRGPNKWARRRALSGLGPAVGPSEARAWPATAAGSAETRQCRASAKKKTREAVWLPAQCARTASLDQDGCSAILGLRVRLAFVLFETCWRDLAGHIRLEPSTESPEYLLVFRTCGCILEHQRRNLSGCPFR